MKYVFLSADDFGRSPARNIAIDHSIRKGLVKSAGLMVTNESLAQAELLIRQGDYAEKIHCHFNLAGSINIDEPKNSPLTNSLKKDSSFCKDGTFLPYSCLPNRLLDVFKCIRVYKELVAQYNRFLQATDSRGNRYHVDFHLFYNLTWPVAIALNVFTWTHGIRSVRYLGVRYERANRRFFRFLSWNPFVRSCRSCDIDFFLYKPELYANDKVLELYCHPDYIEGLLVDNSSSLLGHKRQLLETHYSMLMDNRDLYLLSWSDESSIVF